LALAAGRAFLLPVPHCESSWPAHQFRQVWLRCVGRLRPLQAFFAISNPNRAVFYGNLATLVAAAVATAPVEFIGLRALKRPAYLLSIWGAIATAMYTIKTNYGMPPVPAMQGNLSLSNWKQIATQAVQTLQPWMLKARLSKDLPFLYFALIFAMAYPSLLAPLILGRRALWFVCTKCPTEFPENRLWKYFEPVWRWLKSREKEVLLYSSLAEIFLGIWLAVSLLLPSRQLLSTFMYWNYLKMRYQGQSSREVHDQAWRQMGQNIEPLFKVAPFLNKPLGYVKGWFQSQSGW